jgi:hypothetical protein
MPFLGTGLLSVWNDIEPDVEGRFNGWYRDEHLAERVGLPGFLRGRRYRALDGGAAPAYGALYETETPQAMASADYLARLDDPSPLTAEMLSRFRNMRRTVCRVEASMGRGVGGVLGVLRPDPAPDSANALAAWLADTALPAVAAEPQVLAAHLCAAEPELTRNDSAETRARPETDRIDRWLVLVEASDAQALLAALERHLADDALASRGAPPAAPRGLYRLIHVLDRREL